MPPREWTFRVRDILGAIDAIAEYVRGMDLDRFTQDRRTSDAVVRNLTIIGEAAANVPEAVQGKFPSVPWDNMRRMRNVVVHIYFGVNLPVVWKTIQEDLPPLKAQMQDILKDSSPDR